MSGVSIGNEIETGKWDRLQLSDALDFYVFDSDRRIGAVVAAFGDDRDFVGDVLAFDHFAEDGVLVIEPTGGRNGDEKLAAVGVGSGIGHGKFAGLGMF